MEVDRVRHRARALRRRLVIVPPGQPPLPVLFYSPRAAQDFAAALSAQDRADDPAPPRPLRQDNERGDGH